MKTVFCDESGFDGNNLWHPDQPYFAYSAVCIAPDDADEIIAEAKAKFKTPGEEIHAAVLLRSNRGRKATQWILEQIVGKYEVVCFHKRYSLAGKLFEYMIEPILSNGSTFFYGTGFHKFVATGIYFSTLAKETHATQTLIEFQKLMRERDSSALSTVLDHLAKQVAGENQFLNAISTIMICNQEAIQSELEMFDGEGKESGVVRWILELTVTGLRSLLTGLSGELMAPLVVTCDDSKPLMEGQEFMDSMIGRTDCQKVEFEGRSNQLTFNLAEKLRFSDSASCSGIQLADVAATSATYALKNPTSNFSHFWHSTQIDSIHDQSVFPDASVMDLSDFKAVKNSMILQGLVDRSIQKQSLTGDLRFLDEMSSMAAHSYLASRVE